MSNRVVITKPMVGIAHMQVCVATNATDAEILDVCNRENPSGTQGGWSQVIRDGDLAPVVCDDDGDRLHVLVAC